MSIQAVTYLKLFVLLFSCCQGVLLAQQLADPDATKQTKALFLNLQKAAAESKILFGHQDDLAYGVGWRNVPGASDVFFSCGDYPAVYGWELGMLEHDSAFNLDSVSFKQMASWIREGYARGGVITLSWHMSNYHTGGSAWDTVGAVRDILPGGPHHDRYLQDLDRFAGFVRNLKAGGIFSRHKIPIIFRPFHEHTGDWFWWGKTHCSPEEFKSLWRFTVHYLRTVKKINHLLYAFSTSYNFDSSEEMLEFYPGDEWVDLIGFDFYAYDSKPQTWDKFRLCTKIMVETAEARNKVPALTEFGFEGIPDSLWWTNTFLKNISMDPVTQRTAYVCGWRNANAKHHYVPFPTHLSILDFQDFYQNPITYFQSDLWDFYKKPKGYVKTTRVPVMAKDATSTTKLK